MLVEAATAFLGVAIRHCVRHRSTNMLHLLPERRCRNRSAGSGFAIRQLPVSWRRRAAYADGCIAALLGVYARIVPSLRLDSATLLEGCRALGVIATWIASLAFFRIRHADSATRYHGCTPVTRSFRSSRTCFRHSHDERARQTATINEPSP